MEKTLPSWAVWVSLVALPFQGAWATGGQRCRLLEEYARAFRTSSLGPPSHSRARGELHRGLSQWELTSGGETLSVETNQGGDDLPSYQIVYNISEENLPEHGLSLFCNQYFCPQNIPFERAYFIYCLPKKDFSSTPLAFFPLLLSLFWGSSFDHSLLDFAAAMFTNFGHSTFRGASLIFTNFASSLFENVDFSGAVFNCTDFSSADLSTAKFGPIEQSDFCHKILYDQATRFPLDALGTPLCPTLSADTINRREEQCTEEFYRLQEAFELTNMHNPFPPSTLLHRDRTNEDWRLPPIIIPPPIPQAGGGGSRPCSFLGICPTHLPHN